MVVKAVGLLCMCCLGSRFCFSLDCFLFIPLTVVKVLMHSPRGLSQTMTPRKTDLARVEDIITGYLYLVI